MIVLPINSVINPVLYDNTIREFIENRVRGVSKLIRSLRIVRFFREFMFRRNERVAGGDNPVAQIELTGLEGGRTEPRDPPGNAAQAERIEVADNMVGGPFPDIRELEVAGPEDVIMDTEM
jgi:hypothetical protein